MNDNDKQRELSEEERLMKEIAEDDGIEEEKKKSSEVADPESVENTGDEDITESEPSESQSREAKSEKKTPDHLSGEEKKDTGEISGDDKEQSGATLDTNPSTIRGEETHKKEQPPQEATNQVPDEAEENAENTDEETTPVNSEEQKQVEVSTQEETEKEKEESDKDSGSEIEKPAAKSGEDQISKSEETSPKNEDKEEDDPEDDEEEDEEEDYSNFSKEELVNEVSEILKGDQIKKIEKKIKDLKSHYDELHESERKAALKKFKEEGGAEVDYEYAGDALDNRFSTLYEKYKARRADYYSNLEKEKDANLQKKHEILDKLRNVVEGEETTTSIGALKEIQKEWRSIGPIPSQYAKSLWASYNILIDRFYDNRSIYFELKELDRKKNLEGKLELCEKAEELLDYKNIRDAVKELNDLHEEFKHIGPVPKEVQEEVWQRFKAASDAVYSKRKEYIGDLKKELFDNLEEKKKLVDEVSKYSDFDSDQITEWNEKTREILELQKKWEKIGGLPREHARDVNKQFWSNFKSFFNSKNKFFKKLEGQRDENLKKKEELVKKAEELKESSEWENTANVLKDLQKEWKNIGPVPEKVRNEVYKKFKAACDTFFDRRRAHSKDIEKDYRENLKKKEDICDKIEKLAEEGVDNIDQFKELQVEYDKIGFVPRNAIRKIQRRYDQVTNKFLSAVDIPDSQKSELKFTAEINRLKSGPNANNRINRKEGELRRLISKLENDIALWKNNLEFFADSKTADKLREDFTKKIESATAELNALKEELKVLNKI